MKSSTLRRQRVALFAIVVTLAFALLVAGCGSGGGTQDAALPPLSDVSATTNPITRATENTVSEDAKTLAVRQASGPFVSLDAARAFDTDLAAIRAAYPDAQTLHPKPTYDAKKLLILVDYSKVSFAEKWYDAAAKEKQDPAIDPDLTTGEPALDALIKKYDVVGIEVFNADFGGDYFVLTLGASINAPVAAKELSASSASIRQAAPMGQAGSNVRANVEFAVDDNGSHVYTFSQFYGDGFGIGKVYIRAYTLSRGGGISEKISGTPPE